MSKKDLIAEAEELGVDVEKGDTVADLEAKLAEHHAQSAQQHEDVPSASPEVNVRVENREGAITLVFGSHVPDEEEAGFDEQWSFVIGRDEAVQLAADLPVVAQDAMATTAHTG